MRILYNSRLSCYKDPFGPLIPGQSCRLHIHIPAEIHTRQVLCVLQREDGTPERTVPLGLEQTRGPYEIYTGEFCLEDTGLYFYFFRITTAGESFKLLRQGGEDTNIEAGDLWQVSCIPGDFTTPDWAKGAVMYQIFPDRFARAGQCDLSGKLEPYLLHGSWDEEVRWQPEPDGEVLNNDFFGGNFRGIQEKLDYLAGLGVELLYLNPISKAFSSHRYDTFDYKTPDPMLGTEADFAALCQAVHAHGMRLVLDGVFSHTGSRSLYFDKDRQFGGACTGPGSPYYSWYHFRRFPDQYDCWWNFDTLPCVNKLDPGFLDYVIDGEDSVVAHWLRLGADGFRLDVVDELPDAFVLRLKRRIRALRPDALLIGEVWEDASNKIAYGVRRRYFADGELDSVMNYPYRTAILNFMTGQDAGHALREAVLEIAEHYPAQVLPCVMNSLGTHDTPRILTVLGAAHVPQSKDDRAHYRLCPQERAKGIALVKLAALVLFTFPGSPTVYYGDEAGMEGFEDPFNRGGYPWGHEDKSLKAWFTRLGTLRDQRQELRGGTIQYLYASGPLLAFARELVGARAVTVVNAGTAPEALCLPWPKETAVDLLTGRTFPAPSGAVSLRLPPRTGLLLV